MKTSFFSILLLFSLGAHAQTQFKWNVPATAVLVPHMGIETKISERVTYQGDVLLSFWKSFNDINANFGILTNDVRFYSKEAFKGFYIGPSVGLAGYPKIQKKRYWHRPIYQEGFAVMMGATTGYAWSFNDKLSLDIFVGGGFIQSFNIHRDSNTHERLDKPSRPGGVLNKSGEWIVPFRGGVMLGWRL